MREIKHSALIAQPAARLYALINDIESYPSFIPWCTHARILSRSEREIVATIGVQRGPLQSEFTTRNELDPDRRILMHLVTGPFRMLEGEWLLTPIAQAGPRPPAAGTDAPPAAAASAQTTLAPPPLGAPVSGSPAPTASAPPSSPASSAAAQADQPAPDAPAPSIQRTVSGDFGCRVQLTMKFAFKNPLTAVLFEQKFAETAGSLMDAFVARARGFPP